MKKIPPYILFVLLICYGCSHQQLTSGSSNATQHPPSPSEVKISKQEFGAAWPFNIDEGVLSCKGSGGIGEVVLTANGATYAVNGVAKGTKKYKAIEEIWAENPSLPGIKKDLGPIIERGLKLCR